MRMGGKVGVIPGTNIPAFSIEYVESGDNDQNSGETGDEK